MAILLVLAFHRLGSVSGYVGQQLNGWVGVDLFFVISGFLIASILLAEWARNSAIDIKKFYTRRWLRIAPAYIVFLVCMFGWMVARDQSYPLAFLVAGCYATNFDGAFGWGLVPPSSGLMHTWSLAVEEQFYLLFPLALILARGRMIAFAIASIACVYVWRLVLIANGADMLRMFEGFDTKIDSIMFGVLIAAVWRQPELKEKLGNMLHPRWVQVVIVAMLAAACHWLGSPCVTARADQFALWGVKLPLVLVLMSALVLSLVAAPTGIIARVLSTRPMVWVGKLSYSLYLYHVLLAFWQTHLALQSLCHGNRYLVEFATFACCLALAATSYYVVEKPFLRLKQRFASERTAATR